MAKKKETFSENSEQMFEVTVNRIETWLIKNQKIVTTAAIVMVLLVGGFFGYKYLYQAPREKAGTEELFFAERYFEMDSLNLALNGDGLHYGFIDVIDNYKGTKAANLSYYYVGLVYMQKGDFEEAVSYLKKFKSDDLLITPLVTATIGDAYAEMGDKDQALSFYKKAIASHSNDMITPTILMKAAALCDIQGNFKEALSFYKKIRDEHVQSIEGRDIDKYIAKMEAKLN